MGNSETIQHASRPYLFIGSTFVDTRHAFDGDSTVPLQSTYNDAYAANIRYMLHAEGAIPVYGRPEKMPYGKQLIDMAHMLGDDIRDGLEYSVPFERWTNHYPQDMFSQIGDTTYVINHRIQQSMCSIGGLHSACIQGEMGEGGTMVIGDHVAFYTAHNWSSRESRDMLLKQVCPDKVVKYLPAFQAGIFRTDGHIDQLVSSDLSLPGGGTMIPISGRYHNWLRHNNSVPSAQSLHYLPIHNSLLMSLDLLNTPRSRDYTYLSPVLAALVHDALVHGCDNSIALQMQVDQLLLQGLNLNSIQGRLQAYEALSEFGLSRREAAQTFFEENGLKRIQILPRDMPTNEVQKAGMKCKTNFLYV